MKENIIIIGNKGIGKTTVGKELSIILNYDFLDLDYYINKMTGIKPKELIKTIGERYFRETEHRNLANLQRNGLEKTVLSLGGGTVAHKFSGTRELNKNIVKNLGYIAYITLTPEIPYNWFNRHKHYAEIADNIFYREDKKPLEIADEICLKRKIRKKRKDGNQRRK